MYIRGVHFRPKLMLQRKAANETGKLLLLWYVHRYEAGCTKLQKQQAQPELPPSLLLLGMYMRISFGNDVVSFGAIAVLTPGMAVVDQTAGGRRSAVCRPLYLCRTQYSVSASSSVISNQIDPYQLSSTLTGGWGMAGASCESVCFVPSLRHGTGV
jgi:hypothetical protein